MTVALLPRPVGRQREVLYFPPVDPPSYSAPRAAGRTTRGGAHA